MANPVEIAVETAGDVYPANHPGVDDGQLDAKGEKVVYEYDDQASLIGWHKEASE